MLTPLPIDVLIPELVATFRSAPSLVLEAPPGAGKTTRVPRALLDAGLLREGEVLVLQPRKLAARLAASRVADELNEKPGQTVGYQVRFEDVSSASTRIRFITEGVLTRRLLRDPMLKGVSCVLLDEFHERHLAGDVGLALLMRLQALYRPELRIGVMSATLDATPISAFLNDCPRLRSEGRRFDVSISYFPAEEQTLGGHVAAALNHLLEGQSSAQRGPSHPATLKSNSPIPSDTLNGDVLVFLPGASEIRQAMQSCTRLAEVHKLLLLPLHGELPIEEQDRAIRPADRRKVIFATNVAETSVTIDGVVAVIDSGLARIAGYNPWTGLPTLSVGKISQSSAVQRAGRAGRTRSGVCIRLYSAHDFNARAIHDTPEIRRLDLAETVLELKASGIHDLVSFQWFEAPLSAALESATLLLTRLGALDAQGVVTPIGRRMLAFPVHPRQARMLLEAEARGVRAEGAWLAALVGEKEVVLEQRGRGFQVSSPTSGGPGASHRARGSSRLEVMGPSDLLARMDLLEETLRQGAQADRLRQAGLDPATVYSVERARNQLVQLLKRSEGKESNRERPSEAQLEQALLMTIAAGYPDRLAKRRPTPPKPGNRTVEKSRELIFTFGGTATLAETSVVLEAETLIALDAEARGEGRHSAVRVRLASALEPEWLIDLFPEQIEERIELRWNEESECVEKHQALMYGNLVIESQKVPLVDGEGASILWNVARLKGIGAFIPEDGLDDWLDRVRFVAIAKPELGIQVPTETDLLEVLQMTCEGLTSFSALRSAPLLEDVRGLIGKSMVKQVEDLAPARIRLGNGRMVRVHYPEGQPPFMASRLQDFFGLKTGPTVLGGKVAVVLHLLAPNQRAVQVTTDLSSFWTTHYPKLRRELGRLYPRHAWPEDPIQSEPPPLHRPNRRE